MKKYSVYKITNKINNKVYIGYTSLTISQRFHKHYLNAIYGIDTKLYRSIRKNGISCFKLEEIYKTSILNDARIKEIELIEKYNSFYVGYNMTHGGDGGDCTLHMSKDRKKDYLLKLSIANNGENNNRFSGYTDDEIVDYGIRCYLENNNWIQSYWNKYCIKYNLPQTYSKFRFNGEGFKGLKNRILIKLNSMGYNLDKLEYKMTESHKDNLSKIWTGCKWYHNDELKVNKQIKPNLITIGWELGRKKYN